MNSRTKERLLTGGAVLLICAVGVVLPGCASTQQPRSITLRTQDGVPITITQSANTCTTDFDCEMHARRGDRHSSEWTWKKVAGVVAGMVVAGYVYNRLDAKGGGGGAASPITVPTPKVNCDVAGRPGLGCAQ